MIEQPSPYYLLWPVLIFTEGKYAVVGTQALQADILIAAPYLLFIASAYVILYASAARKQFSLTGVFLFIIGMVFLLLAAVGKTQLLFSPSLWWIFPLVGPILLGVWSRYLRNKNISREVPVVVIIFGALLTYMWTLPGFVGMFLR